MNDKDVKDKHSPAPWSWTDIGVLSDAKGNAIMDCDNWNVTPEDAVVISVAPELLAWIHSIVEQRGSTFSSEELDQAMYLLARATNPETISP